MITLSTKKLTIIASRAPTPNQKIKKPTVAISNTKNMPESINQNCHIEIPPFIFLYTNIIQYTCRKRKSFRKICREKRKKTMFSLMKKQKKENCDPFSLLGREKKII